MVSVKQKRLEGIIRKNISEIIQFFVTFLGQNPRMQAGLRALNRAAGFIRSELSKRMTIRRVPELSFVIDETEMNGRHIDEIIARIHREEKKESE